MRGSIGFAIGWIVAFVIAIAPAQAQRRPKTSPAATKPAAAPATESNAAAGGPAKVAGDKSPDKNDKNDKSDKNAKTKVFDFTGIDLSGRLHTPQLLYFLERANEELERAFLERRSFIPHMVRSLEEEAL